MYLAPCTRADGLGSRSAYLTRTVRIYHGEATRLRCIPCEPHPAGASNAALKHPPRRGVFCRRDFTGVRVAPSRREIGPGPDLYRHLWGFPELSLLDCEAQVVNGKRELRRTYRLEGRDR